MDINWQVDDGYAGKSRSQTTHFDPKEWLEDDSTDDDIAHAIYEAIDDDFRNRVSWCMSRDIGELVEEVRRELECPSTS